MKRRGRNATVWLAAWLAILGCPGSKPVERRKPPPLPLVGAHALAITEPSGLAINDSGTTLWTVTNNPDQVYQLALDGTTVKRLHYEGEDLEGIEYDRSDQTLWVVEENRREIVHLDLNGDVLSKQRLDLIGEKNSGLEGICLDNQGRMFVLNEKNPGLFLELGTDLLISAEHRLGFADDYSGLSSDLQEGCFWIVSDKAQRLFLWSKRNGLLQEYSLPFPKAEGVAVDATAKLMYVVSDSENKLYVYRLE